MLHRLHARLIVRAIPFRYRRPDGAVIRGYVQKGEGALLVFLPGFRSVSTGDKARAIAGFARKKGYACLRTDYIGHGRSDGPFEAFRVSGAIEDVAVCVAQVRRPGQRLFIIGSSMGSWIALEALRRGLLAADGLLLIAPAINFLSRRMQMIDEATRRLIDRQGYVDRPSRYQPGVTFRITREFLDDALSCETPEGDISISCPVSIIHGTKDESVPADQSVALARRIPGAWLHIIEGGDHRLSAHIPFIISKLESLMKRSK